MLPLFNMLVLELNSHCNRACAWCMRHGDLQGRRFTASGTHVREQMPTEQAERLLRESAQLGFRGDVTFYLMSEPYLDDRLIAMAELAKSLRMRPYVNTNGDVLRKRPDLIEASKRVFSWVEVAIYESDKVKAAADVQWWKRQLGAVGRFKALEQMGPRPHVCRPGIALPDVKCHRPREKLVVQYDGSAPICCYDINTEFGLPNAFEISLSDLWHHSLRREACDTLSRPGGRRRYRLCSICPMPEYGYPKPFGAA